jgi:hypothetical protein
MNATDYCFIALLIFLAQARAKDQAFLDRMVVIYAIFFIAASLAWDFGRFLAVNWPFAIF